MKKVLCGLLLAVVLVLGSPAAQVMAADPTTPTTFSIDDVQVVHNIVEAGDSLYAFKYTIAYDSGQPTTPANKLFHFRLMDTDGVTQLGAVEPYAYADSGYGMGYSAFYFTADNSPVWEAALIVKMVGSPQYWGSPPEVNYTLTGSDYSQLDTKSENQVLMGNWVIEVCRTLEINWAVKLLTETNQGTILNDTGAAYGKGTIPGLQTMCPKIFSVQNQTIDTSDRDWNPIKIDEWKLQWDGTVVGAFLAGLAELFSMDWQIVTSFGVGVLVILLFVWGQSKWSDNQAAMIAGIHVLNGSTLMGFLHPAILAILTLLNALYLGYLLMGKHA
ncbi:hypothetical protein [Dehalococcoides mccartyi]|uniref:Uncharacterized protein n=1 Tax=Dehalococcoides mccartyi (strain ATCC BAA-2266 / KCTC 15142 / 195) TaxID=243164 RepID=Q3Z9R7_DEHM1|nr:hypothetical protein [Dehalococcoides mccartyi]AAW39819.1 hypothetical protein DET0894 [Dehalococcoides mccartyi 195]AAW40408.1 hypothetical protein DET0284 [Dehalococcoides mccartyi 195]AAW40455.1 hypothetical protein DET0261 [Dehalococcoides mccartyi 195]